MKVFFAQEKMKWKIIFQKANEKRKTGKWKIFNTFYYFLWFIRDFLREEWKNCFSFLLNQIIIFHTLNRNFPFPQFDDVVFPFLNVCCHTDNVFFHVKKPFSMAHWQVYLQKESNLFTIFQHPHHPPPLFLTTLFSSTTAKTKK